MVSGLVIRILKLEKRVKALEDEKKEEKDAWEKAMQDYLKRKERRGEEYG